MRRRSFDQILSFTGLVVAIALAVAGGLMMWGGTFAHNTVTQELTAQKISFSSDVASLPPGLEQYAGVSVTNGELAKSYSDLIDFHLTNIAGGKTYSQVSEEWIAGDRTDDELAGQRQTLFMGETLRGMLLNAYAFWTFGTIGLIVAWVMFAAAAVLLVLTILGFRHLRRTVETEAIFEPEQPIEPRTIL